MGSILRNIHNDACSNIHQEEEWAVEETVCRKIIQGPVGEMAGTSYPAKPRTSLCKQMFHEYGCASRGVLLQEPQDAGVLGVIGLYLRSDALPFGASTSVAVFFTLNKSGLQTIAATLCKR